MANINLCIMAGNLTDQPKTKALQSGTLIAEFSIAVHRRYKDGEDVQFLSSGSSGNRPQEQQQPQYGNQQRQYTPRIDDADVPGYVPPQKQHGNNQAVKQAQEPIAGSDLPF